ncbi:hypothetical protein CL622_01005 [archaeon]|nr:hypothetical protein [archaeon]
MEWFQFYGWKDNPFLPKSNPRVIGLHFTKKRLLEYVKNGDICFLSGPAGSGKSSLMRWATENLSGYNTVYLSAEETDDDVPLEHYLRQSAWDRLFKKQFVLLLDESQESSIQLQKALKLNWDKNRIRSIIVAQIESLKNFPQNFQHRVGSRLIKLDRMTQSNVADMLMSRTNEKNPLEPEAIEEIGRFASYNPRRVLEFAERVCMEMASLEKKRINLFDVRKVLNGKIKSDDSPNPKILKSSFIKKKKQSKNGSVLSPLEKKILSNLKDGSHTVRFLSKKLKSSEGSIGKQLSKLAQKGIITTVRKERPKKYGLIQK